MFKFVPDGKCVNTVCDIATLEDIAIGYLNDEQEAKRVAEIAGRMKFKELYVANGWGLACVEDE